MTSRWRAVAGAAAALAVTGLLSACAAAGAGETGLSSDTSIEMIPGIQNSSFTCPWSAGRRRRPGVWESTSPLPLRRASPRQISCPWSAA